jgi:hypothetical protein
MEPHDMAEEINDDPTALDAAIRACHAKIDRLATVIAETGNASLVAKLQELEAERDRLASDALGRPTARRQRARYGA